MSRSTRAYESARSDGCAGFTYPNKSKPVEVYETSCGTSIFCRILSVFVKASGYPVIFRKTSCCRIENGMFLDEADHLVPSCLRAKFPAMRDNSVVLFDVGAIIRYLTSKYLGSLLVPGEPKACAVVDQAFAHLTCTLLKSVAGLVESRVFKPFFCSQCGVDSDNCFLRAEADNYLYETEVYLNYVEKFYFRDAKGGPLWPQLGRRAGEKSKPPPCDKPKKRTVHKIGSLSLAEGSPYFTPISSVCFESDAETPLLESLCKVVGYADGFDAVKALVELQKRRNKEKKDAPCEGSALPPVKNSRKLFVVEERFTLADVALFVILDQLKLVDYDMRKNFPLVWNWQRQVAKISSLRDSSAVLDEFILRFRTGREEGRGACENYAVASCPCPLREARLDW